MTRTAWKPAATTRSGIDGEPLLMMVARRFHLSWAFWTESDGDAVSPDEALTPSCRYRDAELAVSEALLTGLLRH